MTETIRYTTPNAIETQVAREVRDLLIELSQRGVGLRWERKSGKLFANPAKEIDKEIAERIRRYKPVIVWAMLKDEETRTGKFQSEGQLYEYIKEVGIDKLLGRESNGEGAGEELRGGDGAPAYVQESLTGDDTSD